MDAISMLDFDIELDAHAGENVRVHAWRAEQLHRLGLPRPLANALASKLDWHQLADLIDRGCPWELALEIAR